MRIMVCGSRYWTDGKSIHGVLAACVGCPTIMEGDCEGVDRLARLAAVRLGFPVETYRPNFAHPSPQRYHERNHAMLDQADWVIAFLLSRAENRGTRSVIGEANARGIPVRVFEKKEVRGEVVRERQPEGILRLFSE